ncbi:MAG: glycosyltransferase family 2 protein [Sarcina sp.]
MKKLTILVPAHNEEDKIEKTLESIFRQKQQAHKIVIICDNCTDKTEKILEKYKNENFEIFKTLDNKGKKAGALNQYLREKELDGYILVMDADTLLDENCIFEGVKKIESNEGYGAVCSRAGILKYKEEEKITLKDKLIWHLQHIEYGQFDAHRIETDGHIKVVHGMAAIFKVEALKYVIEYRRERFGVETGIYLENNLVEDYELTLCIKHKWLVAVAINMLAWTKVPLGIRQLYIQRLRWLRGGVDTVRFHGFDRVVAKDFLNDILFIFVVLQRLIVFVAMVVFIYFFRTYRMSRLVAFVLIYTYIDSFYRMKYTQRSTVRDYIVKFLFIPEILYGLFQVIVMIQSFIYSFFNIDQEW